MHSKDIVSRHWLRVLLHFSSDGAIFAAGFFAGLSLRFAQEWRLLLAAFGDYWPSIFLGAVTFPCLAYVCGLYAPQHGTQRFFRRMVLLTLCLGLTTALMVLTFYLNFSGRIGRGAMLLGVLLSGLAILAHHAALHRWLQTWRERVAFIVGSSFDEAEIELNQPLWNGLIRNVGLVTSNGYRPQGSLPVLGAVTDLGEIVRRERINRVICTGDSLGDRSLYLPFCQLRYSAVSVTPLINLCEETFHAVPLELLTTEWLLSASDQPQMFYIKKLKRAFDILSALVGLVCLAPPLVAGMLAVRLTSPGPVFFRQVRSGRFGRPFTILKLRTMRVDAEKNGAVWAQAKDPRTTPVGHFLRKYRIDEIPQLVNVLRGDMSLVGPRPERPEFVESLSRRIPFFRERLMVQPGITGWAQVNYPYGADAEDARRKLEYDLYYMKHMSVFLDVFVLLDTVRIIVTGGLGEDRKRSVPRYATSDGRPSDTGVLPDSAPVAQPAPTR